MVLPVTVAEPVIFERVITLRRDMNIFGMSFKKIILYLTVATAIVIYVLPVSKFNVVQTVKTVQASRRLETNKAVNATIKPAVPSTKAHHDVYYVWCGRKVFEFKHYLSVVSVLRFLNPDNVMLYYQTKPKVNRYNTWLHEVAEEYPYFTLRQLTPTDSVYACAGASRLNRRFVDGLLKRGEDLYVSERVILTRFVTELHLAVVDDGLVVAGNGSENIRNSNSLKTDRHCSGVKQFVANSAKAPCVVTDEGRLFPKDIMNLDNAFGRLARKVFYGTTEIRQPSPRYDELIPNIAHMIWLGGGEMNFLFYLGVLSLVYVAKVDTVYIHGEMPPTGAFWNLLKNNTRVRHIYRVHRGTVYGQDVGERLSRRSDTWRPDIMFNYGGIYMDTDAVFTKPLDRRLLGYEAIATFDVTTYNGFPNVVQGGVLAGKPGADLWRRVGQFVKKFGEGIFCNQPCIVPYRIWERHPELLLVEPHFQVTCFLNRCHPTWFSDFLINTRRPQDVYDGRKARIWNWRKDAHVLHFTGSYPAEFSDVRSLLGGGRNATIFVEMGKYILLKAGMLDYLTSHMS